METLPEVRHMPAMPVMSLEESVKRRREVTKFIKSLMKEDVDYGRIPGTNSGRTLLKPGAEKLATLFGLSTRYVTLSEVTDWTGKDYDGEPFFYFKYKCQLYYGDMLAGEGIGNCSSWEKKYRYRRGERLCPECGKPAIIKGREEYGGGWICFGKKGGCGAKWQAGDAAIEGQVVGDIKNDNPADIVNTVDKIAQKRSFLAALHQVTNVSEFFNQDMDEDIEGAIDIDAIDVTGDDSRNIPDMTASQTKTEVDNSPPSRGHLGVLFGHLKRLGVRDGHKRQLVEFYSKGELTTHTVNEYNRELEFAVILPWAWFSSYVNMLMIDHPKYDRNTLRDYWKQNFGSAKADDLSIEQREGLINWIFMVEPDDTPEPDTESVPVVVAEPVTEDATESVDEPDADDTYTPDTTLAPSPWLPELQRIQNETQESLEQIEAWLLHKFGKKGTHHKVEDLPVALIDGVTKMSGDQIKESMNTVTML